MTETAVLDPTTPTRTVGRTTRRAARRTHYASPDGMIDAGTHDGLRVALALIGDRGWDCDAAGAVLAALDERSTGWAAQRARSGGSMVDPGDVLSIGWSILDEFAAQVSAARAPWSYLRTAIQNRLGSNIAADRLLSEKTIRWPRHEWPTIYRSGVNTLAMPDHENVDPALLLEEENLTANAVGALVARIAGERMSEVAFWTEAVARALHVMERARRSYEEVELRRDPYLRDVLRLSLKEIAALAALIIGPRRGDRAAHSLLLALRRDPDTSPADVDGAPARIRLLRQRRHTLTPPARVAVAA